MTSDQTTSDVAPRSQMVACTAMIDRDTPDPPWVQLAAIPVAWSLRRTGPVALTPEASPA